MTASDEVVLLVWFSLFLRLVSKGIIENRAITVIYVGLCEGHRDYNITTHVPIHINDIRTIGTTISIVLK